MSSGMKALVQLSCPEALARQYRLLNSPERVLEGSGWGLVLWESNLFFSDVSVGDSEKVYA